MSLRISIAVEFENSAWTFDERRIKRIVRRVLIDHQKAQGEVSIAILDNKLIRRLNRQYLNHNWSTDCLSFVLEEDQDSICGEILASIEMAYRMAPKSGWTGDDELLLYIIHGSLHLVGMDDQDPKSSQLMREAEFRYLQLAKVPHAVNYLNGFSRESKAVAMRRQNSKRSRS